jgi:transposase
MRGVIHGFPDSLIWKAVMSKPKRYELTAEQWRRIEDLLPDRSGDPGRSGADNLTFVNSALWVLRSGAH